MGISQFYDRPTLDWKGDEKRSRKLVDPTGESALTAGERAQFIEHIARLEQENAKLRGDAPRAAGVKPYVPGALSEKRPALVAALAGEIPTEDAPTEDAPTDPRHDLPGLNRPRTREGWFYHALKVLGEATALDAATAERRSLRAGRIAVQEAIAKGLIERVGKRGKAHVYRVVANQAEGAA